MDDEPVNKGVAHREQPMTRLTDPITTANSPSPGTPLANAALPTAASHPAAPMPKTPISDDRSVAAGIRDALAGKQICPFCGSQNPAPASGAPAGPCPRCTMEDSAATRQATKARIGPWHVLQSRNPAAPGMRYATLLALVGKGQVTARSVVRGPTTHQLWRFAAHVKGLSREFGVCYSCGEPLAKTAAHCPHCDRSQEPTGNPDALLESRDPASNTASSSTVVAAPSIVSLAGAAPAPTDLAIEGPSPDAYALASRSAPEPVMSHAQRLRPGATETRPVGGDIRSDLRRRPDGRALSAMELAAALQVSPPPPKPQSHPIRTIAITLVIVGIIAAAIISVARPDLRRQAQDWSAKQFAAIGNAVSNFQLEPAAPPDHSETVLRPSTDFPAAPAYVPPPTPPVTDNPAATARSGESSVQIAPGTAPTPQSDIAPAQPNANHDEANQNAGDHGAGDNATPEPAAPQASARPSLMPDNPVLIGPAPSSDAIWKLHSQGLEAEGRQDWAQAVRCYEQIELAPKELWPSDVKIRLENARRQLGR
jgi:type II secretory pathway pseudopilin PulG